MASVTSLGVHTPVALTYLINEGILPRDPKAEQYQWETYVWNDVDGDGDIEEELLATKDTVVWSQGKFVRNVYRFNHEGEDVVHALLTQFPAPSATKLHAQHAQRRQQSPELTLEPGIPHQEGNTAIPAPLLAKALVVILKTKLHLFYLQGASHILDLPFEVETALPAPQGIILQRKRATALQAPPTPQLPRVPANSFFSSHTQPSSSYLQSPSVAKSFAKAQNPASRSWHGDARLDALFQDIVTSAERARDEDVAALYSLTDPLADFGVVTYSLQHQKTRVAGKQRPALSVEFEGLDPGEEVLYMSRNHELVQKAAAGPERLVLLVTLNREIHTVTVWHAWYLEEKSLRTLLKLRTENREAKARRRSSFLSANIGTGATTPAVRHRDGARESFAAPGTLRLPGEPSASQPGPPTSRKQTQEEEAQAMASQMDPDYQPAGSQQFPRENRRISSMNADVRTGHGTVSASFAAAAGRRHTSFGGPAERRSLGHRRSRGSTPGSVFSRSIGPEDDQMDLDTTVDYDDDETIDNIVRHIRATFDVSGIDNVFGSMEEGFKRELVVRKIHSFSTGPSAWSQTQTPQFYKVHTLSDPQHPRSKDDSRLNMYFHRGDNKSLRSLGLQILHRPLWPEMADSPRIPIPVLISDEKLDECEDVVKLSDNGTEALLLGGRGLVFALDNRNPCPLPTPQPYRVYDSLDVLLFPHLVDKDIGKNRILQPPPELRSLARAGARGTFDVIASDDTRHRRRLQLRPQGATIESLLQVFELVLPLQQARAARRYWCRAHSWLIDQPGRLQGTSSTAESVALVSIVLLLTRGLFDSKARAALNMFKLSSGDPHDEITTASSLYKQQDQERVRPDPTWALAQKMFSHQTQEEGEEKRAGHLMFVAATLADDLFEEADGSHLETSEADAATVAVKLMMALHIVRENDRLCSLLMPPNDCQILAPTITQLGLLLGLSVWTQTANGYHTLEDSAENQWAYIKSANAHIPRIYFEQEPVGIYQWFEQALVQRSAEAFPTLAFVAQLNNDDEISEHYTQLLIAKTPRIKLLQELFDATDAFTAPPAQIVEQMAAFKMSASLLDTFPEAIAAPFREAIARCETSPPAIWSRELLQLVGRDDLVMSVDQKPPLSSRRSPTIQVGPRDILSICQALDQPVQNLKTKEASRHAISQLIFNKDRRLVEATSLMHFNSVQIAECPKLPEWTEAQHFDQQRRIMFFVTVRMIALPAGDGMLHYDSQTPLLTERYHLPGFSSTVLMQPMGHTLTADRSGLTEEKVNWAYFHAGVSAGLRIARSATGIDTSWIAFNKPSELTNRHAGLLLALGLSGHLKHIAKWLSFKYLTPKHTMTSIGLLLGLSASYLGTMDGLITRMLSVHITRMLPPGAAELNVSAVTQTAGLMGIGLLFYNTQHRRMSEVMLSEIEHMEVEDPDSGPDPLRDESYRLAAGFALGLINLARGDDLHGLHGLQLPERLLAVAVGPRPVHAVHVFDRATAGAVVAIALVYMKSGNRAVAAKIDIPDTEAQFDQVRPDVLLLRAMAKHIIMWDEIIARAPGPNTQGWIHDNLPPCYRGRWRHVVAHHVTHRAIDSAHLPLFNVSTGLAWALGLKYAGTAHTPARDEILRLLDLFHTLSPTGGGATVDSAYYDGKLGRAALRRCIDVLALAAATVMAGTGDVTTLRYLRRLHGRTDADTPYGSHLAAHQAVGALFLAGGTHTFGTSPLAVAGLIAAFYPLFPTDVHDNRVHLQAFRHFWVFAAEARCLVVEDIDARRPVPMPLHVILRSGAVRTDLVAPCLLPPLDAIASVRTADPGYWPVTLDFGTDPAAIDRFHRDQRVFVRRCPAAEAHGSIFGASLAALEAVSSAVVTTTTTAVTSPRPDQERMLWRAVLELPAFQDLDQADVELVLPPDKLSSAYLDERGTKVDDRVVLAGAVESGNQERLWNLRMLFAWAERQKDEGDGRLRWLGDETVEKLKARVEARMRAQAEEDEEL